jgi:predicted transcriptional regulator
MADGLLTPTQHIILRIIQESGRKGLSVAEVWLQFRTQRPVSRTTILKIIERLESRDWLRRVVPVANSQTKKAEPIRFAATMNASRTAIRMLRHFVDDYYDGAAGRMIDDLLRFKCLSPTDKEQLRIRLSKNCGSSNCQVCEVNPAESQ